MGERKRKNIIIFALCAVMLVMGVGYALLTSTLTIGATGDITGRFKVVMTEVEPSNECPSDLTGNKEACGTYTPANISSAYGQTSITINAKLYKPGDYVTYRIKVENQGTIAAVYKSINTYTSDSYVEIETNIDDTPGPITKLNPSGVGYFTVTMRLKDLNNSDFAASKGENVTHEFTIAPVFEQETDEPVTPITPPPTVDFAGTYSGTYGGDMNLQMIVDSNGNVTSFSADGDDMMSMFGEDTQFEPYDSSIDYSLYENYNAYDPVVGPGDYILINHSNNSTSLFAIYRNNSVIFIVDSTSGTTGTLTKQQTPTVDFAGTYSGTAGNNPIVLGIDESGNVTTLTMGGNNVLPMFGEGLHFEEYNSNVNYAQYLGYSQYTPEVGIGDYILLASPPGEEETEILAIYRNGSILFLADVENEPITFTKQ